MKILMRSAMALLLLASSPLWADPPGRSGGREHEHEHEEHARGGSERVQVTIGFSDGQREAVRGYYGEQRPAGRACPPGLAKKNNGCNPPGRVKHYTVGKPLPRTIVVEPVPEAIAIHIGLPPPGYSYGMIDGDVVQLVVGTLMVVDAIEHL